MLWVSTRHTALSPARVEKEPKVYAYTFLLKLLSPFQNYIHNQCTSSWRQQIMVCGLQTLGQPKTFWGVSKAGSFLIYFFFFFLLCWHLLGVVRSKGGKTADTSVVCLPKYTHMIKSHTTFIFKSPDEAVKVINVFKSWPLRMCDFQMFYACSGKSTWAF